MSEGTHLQNLPLLLLHLLAGLVVHQGRSTYREPIPGRGRELSLRTRRQECVSARERSASDRHVIAFFACPRIPSLYLSYQCFLYLLLGLLIKHIKRPFMDISEALKSSQSFVRALKAPSDPPQKDGPFKIEIALDAWSDQSFYVPNKGEVIAEWILTKLLKDKSKQCVYSMHKIIAMSEFFQVCQSDS